MAQLHNPVPRPQVGQLVSAEAFLVSQRSPLPPRWLMAEQVKAECDALQQLLSRKRLLLDAAGRSLRDRVAGEAAALGRKETELRADWSAMKPKDGGLKAEAALGVLEELEARAERLAASRVVVNRARELLQMSQGSAETAEPGVSALRDELSALREVWSALQGVNEQLQELRATMWSALIPRKVRGALDELTQRLRSLPARMRQYAVYEYHLAELHGLRQQSELLLELRAVLGELRSDSMRERHWGALCRALGGGRTLGAPAEITLGDVWDAGLVRHEAAVRAVIAAAQGEMIIEAFLRGLDDHYAQQTLPLVNYRGRCQLVSGWESLFEGLEEHITELGSMAASVHMKPFEAAAATWDTKLSGARETLEMWMEVQRRWVHLEAIFNGTTDMQQQLALEFSRAPPPRSKCAIGSSREKATLMTTVARSPHRIHRAAWWRASHRITPTLRRSNVPPRRFALPMRPRTIARSHVRVSPSIISHPPAHA